MTADSAPIKHFGGILGLITITIQESGVTELCCHESFGLFKELEVSVQREGVNPSSMEGALDLSDHISVAT